MFHPRRLVTAGALASGLLVAAAPSAFAQAEASFGDWHVACDNTLTCTAIGFAPGDGEYGWMRIDRAGGAGTPTRMRIVIDFEEKGEKLPVEAKFDEPGFEDIFASPLFAESDGDRFVLTVPPGRQAAFIEALRKAGTLTLRRLDGKKERDTDRARVSLKGAVAALRWLDDRQKRAGTMAALVAGGGAPASASPPPLPPPVRPARYAVKALGEKPPPAAVIEAWKSACDEWDDHPDTKGEGHEIAPRVQLWGMPCSRGAYNFGSMFFLMRGGEPPQLLKFEQWKAAENWTQSRFVRDAEELVNAGFAPDRMAIHFFSKGRGIGDCGSSGAYTWDGRQFRLTSYFAMGRCRGVPSGDWPSLWRSRISNE